MTKKEPDTGWVRHSGYSCDPDKTSGHKTLEKLGLWTILRLC